MGVNKKYRKEKKEASRRKSIKLNKEEMGWLTENTRWRCDHVENDDDGDDDDDDDDGVKNCDDVDDKGENDEIATKTSWPGLTLTTSRSGTRWIAECLNSRFAIFFIINQLWALSFLSTAMYFEVFETFSSWRIK